MSLFICQACRKNFRWQCVWGSHPFPSRTRRLSPRRPKVLRWRRRGRPGGCRSPYEQAWQDAVRNSESRGFLVVGEAPNARPDSAASRCKHRMRQNPTGRTACSYRTLKTEYRESDMKRHRKMKFFLCEEKSSNSRDRILIARYEVDVAMNSSSRIAARFPRCGRTAQCFIANPTACKQACGVGFA